MEAPLRTNLRQAVLRKRTKTSARPTLISSRLARTEELASVAYRLTQALSMSHLVELRDEHQGEL